MNYEEWFPTLIYYDKIDVDGLEEKSYKLKKESNGRIISNRGGWQSHNIEENPLFSKLVNDIEQKALEVHDNIYHKNTGKFKVVEMWVNVNSSKSYNASHIHPNTDLCGNIYVKTSKNCGNTFFEDPRMVHRMNDPYNNTLMNRLTFKQVYYKPETGVLLFFPPWIQHGVEPNMSDEDRIGIAFNMKYEVTNGNTNK